MKRGEKWGEPKIHAWNWSSLKALVQPVKQWPKIADSLHILAREQAQMAAAFVLAG